MCEADDVMEKWDVYDIQGKATGQQKSRNDILINGEYHLAASLWIVDRTGMLLIQKRSPFKTVNPSMWSITGGAVVSGETSIQGCIREVWEELGLKLMESDITLLYRSMGKDTIYDDYVTISDFDIETAVLQQSEVSEIKWASIDEIREMYMSGEFMFEIIAELEKVESYINDNIR